MNDVRRVTFNASAAPRSPASASASSRFRSTDMYANSWRTKYPPAAMIAKMIRMPSNSMSTAVNMDEPPPELGVQGCVFSQTCHRLDLVLHCPILKDDELTR